MHESQLATGLFEECPVPGCKGDSRYFPPGKGHNDDCYYPFDSAKERNIIHAFVDGSKPAPVEPEPSTESKVVITMLMRLYDIQMAMLNEMNPDVADRIYDAHDKGEFFNPEIFIPEIKDKEQ